MEINRLAPTRLNLAIGSTFSFLELINHGYLASFRMSPFRFVLFMKLAYPQLALLAAITLLAPNAHANLGDSVSQSLTRYEKPVFVATISTGKFRVYYTLDHKYLVQQMSTQTDVVEIICYIKMGKDGRIPAPLTQIETDELRSANIPAETTFPTAALPLREGTENEKVWRSDDSRFYMDIGTLPEKDCPFGMTLETVVFATDPGYDHLQALMNSGEMNHLKPDESL